jgi:hypothetical protein
MFSFQILIKNFMKNTIYSLSLAKKDFNNIYDNSGDKKIVFQFLLQDSISLSFILGAWASLNNDYNDNEPEAICKVNRSVDKLPLKKDMFFGDQKLKRNSIKKIHDFLSTATYNFILFEPKVDINNPIYYKISVVDDLDKQPFQKARVGHTDPSPPAPAN